MTGSCAACAQCACSVSALRTARTSRRPAVPRLVRQTREARSPHRRRPAGPTGPAVAAAGAAALQLTCGALAAALTGALVLLSDAAQLTLTPWVPRNRAAQNSTPPGRQIQMAELGVGPCLDFPPVLAADAASVACVEASSAVLEVGPSGLQGASWRLGVTVVSAQVLLGELGIQTAAGLAEASGRVPLLPGDVRSGADGALLQGAVQASAAVGGEGGAWLPLDGGPSWPPAAVAAAASGTPPCSPARACVAAGRTCSRRVWASRPAGASAAGAAGTPGAAAEGPCSPHSGPRKAAPGDWEGRRGESRVRRDRSGGPTGR